MTKRILLVTDSYLPTISGVTTVVSEYKKELEKLGHTVKVLAPEGEDKKNDKNIITVSGIQNIFRSDTIVPLFFIGVKKRITTFKPDVIHIHSPGPLGLWARKWGKEKKIKTVTTIHGTPDFSASYLPLSFLYDDFVKKSGWKFWEWFLETSDVVIAPSHFIVEKLTKLNLKAKIFRAPLWIEPYTLEKKKKNNQTTHFLFFGRLDPDKNLPFLIESWASVKNKNKHLTIAGRDLENQRADLIALTKKFKCSESITVLGRVSEEKKLSLFSETDFFVMPSTVEVQSIVTYQAALSGIPVIVARASALPEIVKNSTAPDLLFNPKNTTSLTKILTRCCTNPDKYRKNYALSKKFARSFKKEVVLDTLVNEIY